MISILQLKFSACFVNESQPWFPTHQLLPQLHPSYQDSAQGQPRPSHLDWMAQDIIVINIIISIDIDIDIDIPQCIIIGFLDKWFRVKTYIPQNIEQNSRLLNMTNHQCIIQLFHHVSHKPCQPGGPFFLLELFKSKWILASVILVSMVSSAQKDIPHLWTLLQYFTFSPTLLMFMELRVTKGTKHKWEAEGIVGANILGTPVYISTG